MPLTSRQQQILALIATGQTTAQIAGQLTISVSTVESHRRNLFRQLGVRNAVGLVKEALRLGLIE
jgi:LuxR family transcriptional regulator, transcriptional regulator of spore coat protein